MSTKVANSTMCELDDNIAYELKPITVTHTDTTKTVEKVEVNFHEKHIYNFLKRAMDIFCSSLALIVFSPLLLIISIIIMIDDPGSPVFTQVRTGKNGKDFKIYKFRSMYKDAEARKKELMAKNEVDGPIFKIAEDPRVTKIGKFIRKTSIDELPQLINILNGDSGIIGTTKKNLDFIRVSLA